MRLKEGIAGHQIFQGLMYVVNLSKSCLAFLIVHIRYIHMSVRIVCNFPFDCWSLCTLQQYFFKENWLFWQSRSLVSSLAPVQTWTNHYKAKHTESTNIARFKRNLKYLPNSGNDSLKLFWSRSLWGIVYWQPSLQPWKRTTNWKFLLRPNWCWRKDLRTRLLHTRTQFNNEGYVWSWNALGICFFWMLCLNHSNKHQIWDI